MNDPKAAATYHPGDRHMTRPDLDALIARLREWADHQDVPAPASNAIDEAVDALAAERARADQAEQILDYVLMIRMYGERDSGKTWGTADTLVEGWLRRSEPESPLHGQTVDEYLSAAPTEEQ